MYVYLYIYIHTYIYIINICMTYNFYSYIVTYIIFLKAGMPEKRLQVKPWNMLLFQTHFGGRRSQRFLVESWLTAARCCFANTMPPKAVRKSSEEVAPGELDRAQIHPKYGEFGGDEEIVSYFC
jgi:hypothetical protein